MHRRMTLLSVIALILLIGTMSSAGAEETWVSIDGTSGPKHTTAEVLHSNEKETLIKFDIPGFWVKKVTEFGETYHILSFPGYATTTDIGKAALPIISDLVAIPASSRARVRIIATEETVLEGYHVYPFQTPLNIGEKRTTFDIDRPFYHSSTLYPKAVNLREPGIWRDLPVTNLRVAPVRYNPVRDKLHVCKSMTVAIEYHYEQGSTLEEQTIGSVKPNYDAMYRRNVLNYKELNASVRVAPPPTEGYDLLIILGTGPTFDFTDNIQPLVIWKDIRGISTKVILKTEIGGNTPPEIRAYIKNEFDTYDISYVLIVGIDISPYYGYDYIDLSDYYYACLTHDGEGVYDDYPDIAVGRLPAISDAELDDMINKSIAYERDASLFSPYLDRVPLIAHWDPAATSVKMSIHDANTTQYPGYYQFFTPTFIDLFGADGATDQQVIDNINTGARVVNYIGHGTETLWYDWNHLGNFDLSDLMQLDNGVRTPVVFSMACRTADFYHYNECFGKLWLDAPDRATAFFGATMDTEVYTTNMYDREIFNALYDDGVLAIGDATNTAVIDVLNYHGPGLETVRKFLWLGDPTLVAVYEPCDLLPPTLLYPGNYENISGPTQVTLDWDNVAGADYYVVQVAEDPEFTIIVAEEEYSKRSTWTTPELTTGTYYWLVRAGDERGYGYPPLQYRQFTIVESLGAPVLYSPEDGTQFEPGLGIVFKWYKLTDVDSYVFQIDDQRSFNNPYDEIVCSCTEGPLCNTGISSLPSDTYYWRVRAENGTEWSDVWSFEILEGAGSSFSLTSHPNPFNPATTITYSLAKESHVNLSIYNVKGQLVRTLVDELKAVKEYRVVWDGTDNNGIAVASGIYFYAIRTDSFNSSKKLILLR